jgi:hypothetical protein
LRGDEEQPTLHSPPDQKQTDWTSEGPPRGGLSAFRGGIRSHGILAALAHTIKNVTERAYNRLAYG